MAIQDTSNSDLMELEIKFFTTLVSGPEEIKKYLVTRLNNPKAFNYIPHAWEKALELLHQGTPIDLTTFPYIEGLEQIEIGMIESAQFESPIQTLEEAESLSGSILETYNTGELIKAVGKPIDNLTSGQSDYADTLSNLADALEALAKESADKDLVGLGLDYDHTKVTDKLFNDELGEIIPTGFEVFDEKAGGLARGEQLILTCPTSSGKSVCLNTPIIMHDGSIKRVQDIKKGELLMGPDSKPRKVLGTGTGYGEMYEIWDKNKNPKFLFGCNGPHVLSVKWNANPKRDKYKMGEIINIPVDEYINKSKYFQQRTSLWKPEIVHFPEKSISFDPRLVGLYLGDGTASCCEITSNENDIETLDYVDSWALHNNYTIKYRKQPGAYKQRISFPAKSKSNPFFTYLKESAIFKDDRRIPKEYLYNSEKIRLEMLAGLLDSDGYYDSIGHDYEIITKYPNLAKDIVYLARSLGFKTANNETIKGIKELNFTGTYQRIYIMGDLHRIPCKVKRKKAEPHKSRTDRLITAFTVKPVGKGTYYSFELDGDHLFLLGDFTVTHNSTMMNQLALNMGLGMLARQYKRKPLSVLFYSLEMSEAEMWKRIFANLCGIHSKKFRMMDLLTEEDIKTVKDTARAVNEYLAGFGCKITMKSGSDASTGDIRTELATHNYDILCIDYLNLMAEGTQLWSEMGKIARDLKLIAQRRNLVCITAAQLDEESLKIRYSRMIKEHCDLVWMWTPKEVDATEEVDDAFSEIFVAKGRNTGKFAFWVKFDFRYMIVSSMSSTQELGMYEAPLANQNVALPSKEPLALPNNAMNGTALAPNFSPPAPNTIDAHTTGVPGAIGDVIMQPDYIPMETLKEEANNANIASPENLIDDDLIEL